MDTQHVCQLYKYDPEFFLITKESPAYFAEEFVETSLDSDFVSWLNFHSLQDKPSIQRLCEHLQVDLLTMEDIYEEKRRPKLEEYPNYLFFQFDQPCHLREKHMNWFWIKSVSYLEKTF